MSKLFRYPGAQPFEVNQQHIFFGRKKDIDALCRLTRLESLTVLYSKSGLGKSSIINAGVIPQITKETSFVPLRVRFNAYNKETDEKQLLPMVKTREIVKGTTKSLNTFLDKLIENEETLWHDLKEQHVLSNGEKSILLIFDQFEELFTYPADAILTFRKQLAEALYTNIPQRYLDVIDLYGEKDYPFSEREQMILQRPMELRVLVAIRQDRMHLLGNLSDYLPTISKTWYELSALDNDQARQAIILPAQVQDTQFNSNTFEYEEKALLKLLDFLTENGTEKIESTQLQIICNHIEKKELKLIKESDVENLSNILEDYYDEKINSLDASDRLPAKILIEEGLIYEEEERRLSLYEGFILRNFNITSETLKKLVDSHLLRAEPSLQGGYTYELSHDTLVVPILKAKQRRVEKEKEAREQIEKLQREREIEVLRGQAKEEKRKRQRARLFAIGAIILSIISITALWFAVQQNKVAKDALEESVKAQKVAEESLNNMKKAQANLFKNQADAFFSYKEYQYALNFYQKALSLMPDDIYLLQQINSCKEKIK